MSPKGLRLTRLKEALRDTLDHSQSVTGKLFRTGKHFWKLIIGFLPFVFALGWITTDTTDPKRYMSQLAARRAALLAFCVVVVALLAAIEFVKHYRRNAPYKDTGYEHLPKLDSTQQLLAKKGRDFPAIGSAIEIFAYPFRSARLEKLGWSVENVKIRFHGDRVALDHRLDVVVDLAGRNNPKYSLSDYEHVFSDSADTLRLTVEETSWLETQKARVATATNPTLRHELTSFEPKRHQIPSSLCLHFVCLTVDNEFICLRRKSNVDYYPNSLSISFEEQFSLLDVQAGEALRATAWFRRAICEEVLPLTGLYHDDPAKAWTVANQYVELMRICSCFLEEDTGNYSIFALLKLKIDARGLATTSDSLRVEYNSVRDDEGRLFCLPRAEVEKLLKGEQASARSLFSPEECHLDIKDLVKDLHPTSLYRALRVVKALPTK